jgi:hypothetical protein
MEKIGIINFEAFLDQNSLRKSRKSVRNLIGVSPSKQKNSPGIKMSSQLIPKGIF